MLKRILIPGVAALLLTLFLAPHASAFGVGDVIQMHQDGISDDLILEKIQHSGKVFHLDAGDMRDLKKAGVPDSVITAMLRTEDRDEGDDTDHSTTYVGVGVGWGGWCGPWYGPIYDPWWPRPVRIYGGWGGRHYGYVGHHTYYYGNRGWSGYHGDGGRGGPSHGTWGGGRGTWGGGGRGGDHSGGGHGGGGGGGGHRR